MVNVHKQIMSTLNTILPTYYELFCDSTTAVPCITYMESSNYAIDEGETLGYSRVGFTVKVWDTNIAHAQTIAESVDSKLRKLGFKRTSSNELHFNNNIQKILTYEGLGLETFSNN